MRTLILAAAVSALPLGMAAAQTSTTAAPSITLYELPGFLGRSVTITGTTPDLATQSFAKRARSARVVGDWEICAQVNYGGSCQSFTTGNQPLLSKSGIVSLRPTGVYADTNNGNNGNQYGQAVDLDELDPNDGVAGQDVTFFAQPMLSGMQVSAGTNDLNAARAFCERAGFSGAAYAGRARVRVANIVDTTGRSRVRGFPLRDVLCRR